jgi:hypothetical protein
MQRFKMLARDNNSLFIQYRTWVVSDEPDFNGDLYFGLKSGLTPFFNTSTFVINDGYVVADFNLPNPIDFDVTKLVLPQAIYNSQLAVIDGYVYLFGGEQSSKIYRATLDNPASWEDTGADLPTDLASSQIAVIDDSIYLFGGDIDGEVTDHIYSASVSDPLSWIDNGALLPNKVSSSQLIISSGNIYLLGGFDGSDGLNTILTASAATPLTWSISGSSLPVALFKSHVAIIDGYVYLFGGQTEFGTPIASIYKAPVNSLGAWTLASVLPYAISSGQFFTIGDKGYIIAPSSSSVSYAQIFICNLATPSSWIDTRVTVPGLLSDFQFAIIGDRILLFGGNGSTVIYADNSIIKYKFDNTNVVNYGFITRTLFEATPTLDLFSVLCFPPWKTNYGL